jgi:hypothetical protein
LRLCSVIDSAASAVGCEVQRHFGMHCFFGVRAD